MDYREMRRRLNNGENPLDLSIEKWEGVAFKGDVDSGGCNCSLCEVYFIYGCIDCPVRNKTGLKTCNNTPFRAWVNHHEALHNDKEDRTVIDNCGMCKSIAKRELEFLKSCKE